MSKAILGSLVVLTVLLLSYFIFFPKIDNEDQIKKGLSRRSNMPNSAEAKLIPASPKSEIPHADKAPETVEIEADKPIDDPTLPLRISPAPGELKNVTKEKTEQLCNDFLLLYGTPGYQMKYREMAESITSDNVEMAKSLYVLCVAKHRKTVNPKHPHSNTRYSAIMIHFRDSIVTHIAAYDPQEALRWAEKNVLFKIHAYDKIATQWASHDPRSALVWAETRIQESGDWRPWRHAMAKWKASNPKEAMAWEKRIKQKYKKGVSARPKRTPTPEENF